MPHVTFTHDAEWLRIEFACEGASQPGRALFVALDSDPLNGCAVVPYAQHYEGSTVFLPFRADRLFALHIGDDGKPTLWRRKWERAKWSERIETGDGSDFTAEVSAGKIALYLKRHAQIANATAWVKDTHGNYGWGEMLASVNDAPLPRFGDTVLASGISFVASQKKNSLPTRMQPRCKTRPRIYQLLPRLFSNTNETRKTNGALAENGVGKFADINDAALRSLRDELGITHLWLTGVIAQATSTDYSHIGKPADDPDLLKGLAGSPYAIKDYMDVCPDYVVEPKKRMEEFKALLKRAHSAGLRVLIDFVPNHVARSHAAFAPRRGDIPVALSRDSGSPKGGTQKEGGAFKGPPAGAQGDKNVAPPCAFGEGDDRTKFFAPNNNFFWLQHDSPGGGPPLRLPTVCDGKFISPTCRVLGAGDGLFPPETEHARVTGNNTATWSPSQNDWYETVKLNYGFDFTTGARAYPHAAQPDAPVPDTWVKMDAILAHWQSLGVDGFRCDMAHMVPPEFWAWAIARARQRQPDVMFIAEAYNNDPMKVEGGYELVAHFKNVMIELLSAGFDAVYDDPAYKALKNIYDGPGWANDLDAALGVRDGSVQPDYVFQNSLRYAENHDEVRIASNGNWGGIGMDAGRAVSSILFGISRGPVLLYSGQEVGEPADSAEGFSDDNGRTSIFDYWSMPEFAKWVNGHQYDGGKLSPQQKSLRECYGRLMKLCGEPAFRDGEFFPLNGANIHNEQFGRIPGEGASGHWLYAYIRADARSGSRYLVVANLHRSETFRDVRLNLTDPARATLGKTSTFTDKLSALGDAKVKDGVITLPPLPPLTAAYFEAKQRN